MRLFEGVTGDASHLLVDHASEYRCALGCRGCLETVASGLAIDRTGREAARTGASQVLAETLAVRGDVLGADVASAARGGDEVARSILRRAGEWLGIGLASWAAVYGPDVVVLGGGVALAGDEWLSAAVESMHGMASRTTCVPWTCGGRSWAIRLGSLGRA